MGPTTGPVRRLVQNGRVAWAHGLTRVLPGRRSRAYYAKALYHRGYIDVQVNGLSGRFQVRDPGDFNFLTGEFLECDQIKAFLPLLRPDDVIYEVGGHIGSWTVFMAKCAPAGKVCVFEPAPDNFARLQANVALNGLSNVTLSPLAVAQETGHISFGVHVGQADPRHSVIVTNEHHAIQVPSIRLDDAVKNLGLPAPTVIKIDCEGGEIGVLAGMKDLLAARPRMPRIILLEAHGVQLGEIGRTIQDAVGPIEAAGYKAVRTWSRAGETIGFYEAPSTT